MSKPITLGDIVAKLDLLTQVVISNKNTLSLAECAAYTGWSESHLYKLTSTQQIPHYKPRGKMIYFDRAEIDEWLLQNRVGTIAETEQMAANHVMGVA